jgi:hypothetical protein
MDLSKELLEAIKNGDVVKVKELLERGAMQMLKITHTILLFTMSLLCMKMILVRILLSY